VTDPTDEREPGTDEPDFEFEGEISPEDADRLRAATQTFLSSHMAVFAPNWKSAAFLPVFAPNWKSAAFLPAFAPNWNSATFSKLFTMPPLREHLEGFSGAVSQSVARALLPAMEPVLAHWREQQKSVVDGLFAQVSASFKPVIDHDFFRTLERRFLPPNLRDASTVIRPSQVLDFLHEEGIPLYLVPRASVGVRLIRATDHAKRRKVLNDCFDKIVEDCEVVLADCSAPITATEVEFTLDGLGALHAGHYKAAQALFTVTLDTLVAKLLLTQFGLAKAQRGPITRRKKGSTVPDLIDDMGIRDTFIWLAIWNAHSEFWEKNGDKIPHDYSRHATVHAVSRVQYSKRNCVQALMLVTSLIGYTDLLYHESQQAA
jgi:hypothetical protein